MPFDFDLADATGAASPEAAIVERERLAILAAAVDQLPDVQRDALALRYAAGLTAREIGAALGKTEHATQKLISRALATLREDYRHDR